MCVCVCVYVCVYDISSLRVKENQQWFSILCTMCSNFNNYLNVFFCVT